MRKYYNAEVLRRFKNEEQMDSLLAKVYGNVGTIARVKIDKALTADEVKALDEEYNAALHRGVLTFSETDWKAYDLLKQYGFSKIDEAMKLFGVKSVSTMWSKYGKMVAFNKGNDVSLPA